LCLGSHECFERAASRRAFERALRRPVNGAAVEQLRIALHMGPADNQAVGSEGSVL
jgi:predicted RNA-binding protein YlxR (DUF448 family)